MGVFSDTKNHFVHIADEMVFRARAENHRSVQDDQELLKKNIHVVCYCVRLWLRVDTSSLGFLSVNLSGLHKIQNFSVLPGLLW